MSKEFEQFDMWLNEEKCPHWNHREVCIAEDAWEAALEMIYYKGVLDSTLAGDLIKEELPDGSI